MDVGAGWVQQRQSGIGFNDLSAMVYELVASLSVRAPRKQTQDPHTRRHYLPQDCLNELMDFHVRNSTHWLNCYQRKLSFDRAIEVDKISVMAQADCLELG